MNQEFQKARENVCAALNNPKNTVGTSVSYGHPMVIIGNLACDDPALSIVAIDDLGRLWKEHHRNGKSELVCILDLRYAFSLANPERAA